MAYISNTTVSQVGLANAALLGTFAPRSQELVYPKLAMHRVVHRQVEPYTFLGAPPNLSPYAGTMRSTSAPSFQLNIPNVLFKNWSELNRLDVETDQIGAFTAYLKGLGIILAQAPDLTLFTALLNGSTASSATLTSNDGVSYTMTLDGKPIFSDTHAAGAYGNQSNIVRGNLPATRADFLNYSLNDQAVLAKKLQNDLALVIDAFSTFQNTNGQFINPYIDPKDNIVVIAPSFMRPAMRLAFQTPMSVISQTTNVSQQFVKDVLCSPFAEKVVDDVAGTTVTPVTQTDYYVAIVNDPLGIKPFIHQTYAPPGDLTMFGNQYNPQENIDAAAKASDALGFKLSEGAAAMFASASIDHNLNAIGSNAQASVIQREKFDVSARAYYNVVPGPWYTLIRVTPSNTSSSST